MFKPPACFEKGPCMLRPVCLVKIDGEEIARLIPEHGIHAHDEFLAVVVLTGEMAPNRVVGNREELLVLTFRTLDARLFADALNPFVGTGRRVSGLAGLAADEPARIDIVAAAEQRAEESDLCFAELSDDERRCSVPLTAPVAGVAAFVSTRGSTLA